jgi:hypothetical protein
MRRGQEGSPFGARGNLVGPVMTFVGTIVVLVLNPDLPAVARVGLFVLAAFGLVTTLALVVLAPRWSSWLSRWGSQRREALRGWAATAGWTEVGSSDRSLADRWRRAPFGTGRNRRVAELMVGPAGRWQAASFCYTCTTGQGRRRVEHAYHVVTLALPVRLPALELTSQVFGGAEAFGGSGLEFESEEFNRRWRVEADDPKFASDVLHPRLMARLCRVDSIGLSIRIDGSDVLCWSAGPPIAEFVGLRVEVLRAIAEAIPRFVWLDHGYDPE